MHILWESKRVVDACPSSINFLFNIISFSLIHTHPLSFHGLYYRSFATLFPVSTPARTYIIYTYIQSRYRCIYILFSFVSCFLAYSNGLFNLYTCMYNMYVYVCVSHYTNRPHRVPWLLASSRNRHEELKREGCKEV